VGRVGASALSARARNVAADYASSAVNNPKTAGGLTIGGTDARVVGIRGGGGGGGQDQALRILHAHGGLVVAQLRANAEV